MLKNAEKFPQTLMPTNRGMKLYVEGNSFEEGIFITAEDANGNVLVRCNFNYTDCEEDEKLDAFITRHDGAISCIDYLKEQHHSVLDKLIRNTQIERASGKADWKLAEPDKTYIGKIVDMHTATGKFIQHLGRHSHIVHEATAIDRRLEIGDHVTIHYDGQGLGKVAVLRENIRSASVER
jgi:hypothetical protein